MIGDVNSILFSISDPSWWFKGCRIEKQPKLTNKKQINVSVMLCY